MSIHPALEIEYCEFPESLNWCLYLDMNGVRYYNTRYAFNPETVKIVRFEEDKIITLPVSFSEVFDKKEETQEKTAASFAV